MMYVVIVPQSFFQNDYQQVTKIADFSIAAMKRDLMVVRN
jgi:hypothetical protein